MKELENIVADLKKCVDLKETEVNASLSSKTYHRDALKNRKIEVALFEKSSREITTDPTLKNKIISEFTKGAEIIKNEIDKIQP